MLLLHKSARAYIYLGFWLLAVAGSATIYLAIRAGQADLWVEHTLKVDATATSLLGDVEDAELVQREFLITGQDGYLAQAGQAYSDISSTIAALNELTSDSPVQQAALSELQRLIGERLARLQTTLTLVRDGRRQEALNLVKSGLGADLMKQIETGIGAFQERERNLLSERQQASAALRIWLLVLIFCSLAGATGLAAFLWRQAQAAIDRLREQTAELAREANLRRETEGRLRQAQKLEAVGQLTGGIAHDFNNLLTIILGNLETLQRRLAKLPLEKFGLAVNASKPIEAALRASESAAQLTHRLLAFSRQQPLDPRQLDLNQVVSGMSDLLRRTLGETFNMETVLAGGLWPAFADANQVENALINLCLNARDAMPEGGHLTIETANAYLDDAYAMQFEDVQPGQYVLLSVADTGSGIAPSVLQHVFEPFFTTKRGAQGSGLGLAMVYGFVKQSGGHVRIYSEVGHGTTVKIYLPRLLPAQQAEAAPAALPHDTSPAPRASAGETVLLVEDNSEVREYAKSVLEELGYGVVEAADADNALNALRDAPRIDLLFTDVVLPGASGRELSGKALELRAGMPVLFTTGYTRNAIVHQGRLDPRVHLLNKPYTQQDLARKIREVLDSSVSRPEAAG
jgi:signal transduction histidine kinase/ActR/RegA family two-component response regulator